MACVRRVSSKLRQECGSGVSHVSHNTVQNSNRVTECRAASMLQRIPHLRAMRTIAKYRKPGDRKASSKFSAAASLPLVPAMPPNKSDCTGCKQAGPRLFPWRSRLALTPLAHARAPQQAGGHDSRNHLGYDRKRAKNWMKEERTGSCQISQVAKHPGIRHGQHVDNFDQSRFLNKCGRKGPYTQYTLLACHCWPETVYVNSCWGRSSSCVLHCAHKQQVSFGQFLQFHLDNVGVTIGHG